MNWLAQGRLVRVLAVYVGESWLVLQLTALLREEFQLRHWVTPVAAILLLVGLVVIVATAWGHDRVVDPTRRFSRRSLTSGLGKEDTS